MTAAASDLARLESAAWLLDHRQQLADHIAEQIKAQGHAHCDHDITLRLELIPGTPPTLVALATGIGPSDGVLINLIVAGYMFAAYQLREETKP